MAVIPFGLGVLENGTHARLVLRPILAILGLYHLLLGVAMVAAPRTFFDEVATYGVFNDHYIRDVASFYLALGIVMLVAVAKVSWQTPRAGVRDAPVRVAPPQPPVGRQRHRPRLARAGQRRALALIGAVLFWLLRGGGEKDAQGPDGEAVTPPR